MADKEKPAEDVSDKPASSSSKNLIILAAAMLVLVMASVGGTYMVLSMQSGDEPAGEAKQEKAVEKAEAKVEEKAEDKPAKPAEEKTDKPVASAAGKESHYLPLDPPFVVNFSGSGSRARFLQLNLEVMAHDREALEGIKKHMPVVRNNLVLLFSSQSFETLNSHEGKEKLRTQALEEIQKVLVEHTGKPGINAVYFTSFIIQ